MPYLQNEEARARAEVQAAEGELANLTAQVQVQQQAIADAQAQSTAARNSLTGLQAQLPSLQASAASADQSVADANAKIRQHEQTEPDEFIERPNKKPFPNPQWAIWKRRLDALIEDRDQAAASAAAAHSRLNDVNNSIANAQTAVQVADLRLTQANAALVQLNQAVATARDKSAAAHHRLDDLTRFSTEIDRDPMDRAALEDTADRLSTRVLDLEDAYRAAEAAAAAADAAVASLLARRNELTAALATITAQIPAANGEVSAAEAAVTDLAGQIDDHIAGGP